MAKVRRNVPIDACHDEQDSGELPIVSGESAYGGRGAALTAVVVDGDKAWFEEEALHGRTAIEQRVTWADSPEDVPNGRHVHPVWVYIRPAGRGEFQYFGLVANEMLIDEERGVGYKYLAEHVNRLEKAMGGQVDLSLLDDVGRRALADALRTYPEVLENSRDEVKEALGLPVAASNRSTAPEG